MKENMSKDRCRRGKLNKHQVKQQLVILMFINVCIMLLTLLKLISKRLFLIMDEMLLAFVARSVSCQNYNILIVRKNVCSLILMRF